MILFIKRFQCHHRDTRTHSKIQLDKKNHAFGRFTNQCHLQTNDAVYELNVKRTARVERPSLKQHNNDTVIFTFTFLTKPLCRVMQTRIKTMKALRVDIANNKYTQSNVLMIRVISLWRVPPPLNSTQISICLLSIMMMLNQQQNLHIYTRFL